MAILQSTGIRGFLVSVKKTGNKVVNSIGKTIDEYTENFLSGFAGHGWKLWEYISGKYKLEIDALMVRGTFTVFELLVQKIRSIKGALGITQGNGKIKTVTLSQDGTEYLITLEDEMSFVANDFIRCQTFTGISQKLYHVPIRSISESNTVIHLSISDFNVDTNGTILNPPEAGDEIVQFGNSTDTTRQSAIYIHADEGGQPAIDVMFGINSTDWSNTVKIRIGGEIPGSGGLRGFYCVNGMIKGVTESGHVTYCIYPNGSAMFGDGSAEFRADKSGYVAGGAISWQWDEARQKFVTSMGDVILDWNNLSDEAKVNLTGPQGAEGPQGVAGPAGSDGVTYYTWIRYADTSVGGGISNDPTGKLYIGLAYNKTTATESNTPSDYTWSLIKGDKGDTGVQGATGADGITYYTWIKYSDNSDGTGLYDIPTSNTQYIGIAVNKTTATESTVKTDYTWSKFKGDTGATGPPGADGADANLLPWVQDYDNNKTLIDGEYVVSPKMFSGTKDVETNKLTGVAFGRGVVSVNGVKKTGVFGVKNGEITFNLDSETGDVKLAGHVEAKSGSIGDLEIIDGDIVGKDSLGVIRLLVSKSELSSFADLNEESRVTVIERQESQPALFNLSLSWARPADDYDIEAGYDYSNASAQLISDSPVFATTGGCNLILDLSTSLHVGEYTISNNGQLSRYIRKFEIIDSISQAVVYSGNYTGGIENASVGSSGSYFCRIYYTVALSYIVADQSSEDASGYIYGDFTIDAIYGVKRTLIGSDGLYSYWGPHDYIYAKRNTSGQLDIKMRGNIEIMKRDGTVLISG